MSKEITIYDIAKKLNVSPSTVSRALNNYSGVNENTRKRIVEASSEMGYRSNIFASILRRKRTRNIGVIVPRLNSAFQSTVLAGMEKVANEHEFNLIVSQSLESLEKEKANSITMFNSRVDGLLVSLAGNTKNVEHFQRFIDKKIPILFFDRVSELHDFTAIVIDNVQAAYSATKHMIEQGCKNIIHVLGSTQISVYSERLKGYKYALIDHEIPFKEENVIYSDLTESAADQAVEKILAMSPHADGIFVSNDECAAACISRLKHEGIKIPQDIAVVGFNNEMISRMIEPNLTTINYPGYEMGEVAMRNLINHLQSNPGELLLNTNTITLHSKLIIRESSLRMQETTNP